MKRTVIFGAVLSTALSIGLAAPALSPIPAAAYADETTPQAAVSSGWTQVSNLEWKLDGAAAMVLRPLGGQGSAKVNDNFSLNVSDIASNVKNFRVEGSIEFSGPASFNSMFCGCSALETVDLSGITVANSADAAQMFENCPSLTSVKLPKQLAPTSAKFMFYNCKKLQAIDLSGCDFRSLKTADYMFGNCSALAAATMPASEKATFSSLETMNGMFTGCSSLQTLDLTSSAFPNVREAEYAFSGCTNLRTATITGLNGSNIAMEGLFDGCTALASITVKKPTGTTADIRPSTMSYAFRNCSSLQSLDLNSFDTRSATSMSKLFNGCSKLTNVALGPDFRFEGCGQSRLCSLPAPADTATYTGKWISSVDGNAYAAESVPTTEGKAVTWTAQKSSEVGHGLLRLAGDTRYSTMAKLVQRGSWKQGGLVIVASGENFPDALAAASLAGQLGAPIVLTGSNDISNEAAQQLASLNPKKVYIVGGTAAVSSKVENWLKARYGVERLAGATRYDTAQKIAGALSKSSDTVIIATGESYADALSISPYAYTTGSPVVLCNSKSGLDTAAANLIKQGGYTKAIIVGGTAAVPAAVTSQLKSANITAANQTRLAGATRYDTSCQIAKFELSSGKGFTVNNVMLATGENFPDALAAGPTAGQKLAPLLLVDTGGDATAGFLKTYKGQVTDASIAGGTNAVSNAAALKVAKALGINLV